MENDKNYKQGLIRQLENETYTNQNGEKQIIGMRYIFWKMYILGAGFELNRIYEQMSADERVISGAYGNWGGSSLILVTDKRILAYNRGIIGVSNKIKDVPIKQITDTSMNQTVFGRLWGHINVKTASNIDDNGIQIRLWGKDVPKIKRAISKAQGFYE